jgi:transcriptional antiterminator RfaH
VKAWETDANAIQWLKTFTMSLFNSGWYLLYTRPQCEKKVAVSLTEKSISHYLPLQWRVRTWSDRRKLIESPLFPSYVFVHLDGSREYIASLDTDGVVGYVRFGKTIAKVDSQVVNNLKLVTGHTPGLEVTSEPLAKGRRLMISDGLMAGLDCEVVEHRGAEKILVRVHMLNRNVLMTISPSLLVPIETAAL